jgi:endopeptidase La
MKDNKDTILTRSQRKKLEIEKAELSFLFLKTTISRSILKYLFEDIKAQGEGFKIESYLRKLGKELKTKEIELQVEYDEIDPKKLTETQQLYIGSVEITNEFFKDIIKEILKEKKNKKFNILQHLKKRIKEEEKEYMKVSKELSEINDKLKGKKSKKQIKMITNYEEDSDVDEKGNIKGLIDYSDEEDIKLSEKQIRDYGKYVHRLKGKELEKFVNKEMKSIQDNKVTSKKVKKHKKNVKEESESESDESEISESESESEEVVKKVRKSKSKMMRKKLYEYSSDSDDDSDDDEESEDDYDSDEDEDYEDYDEEEEELLDLLGDEWEKKDLDYLKLRHTDNNERKKDIKYFRGLAEDEKDQTLELIETINKMNDQHKPLLFKVIESGMSLDNKANVIKKLEGIESSEGGGSDYFKLKTWVEGLLKVPFGIYKSEKVSKSSSKRNITKYLNRCSNILDKAVYGHSDAKRHILQILAQNISNEDSKGNIFGIQGPMGNGKTTLVEEGIAKSLNRPFAFISLGGATDSAYLEGHGYTYEGSIWGQIVEVIMKSGCMNPIIYFDELDKVSETPKGDEIINILMHLTDHSQNTHFHDKYFQGIDFDLSKAIIVFSYNDMYKINPILRDRIVNIKTKGFKNQEKLKIAQEYLMPKILKDVGIYKKNFKISNELVTMMIESYTSEGGVRKLKELLYEIIREVNLREMTGGKLNNNKVVYPFEITEDIIKKEIFHKKYEYKIQNISETPRVGIVNGLYASSNDTGGITVVEALPIPTSEKLGLELTGQQGDVMKESMKVARSVAWSILPDNLQEDYQSKWKNGATGIHLHCPEGATPKDGPSAGGAITTAIISLLTGTKIKNDVAMTGEINLSGQITEIGGLDSKLNGAKKAGVKLALIPKDNEKDLHKIIKEDSNLIEKSVFDVQIVSDIYQILDFALVKNSIKFKGCNKHPVKKKNK